MNNNYLYESVLTDKDKNILKNNNIEVVDSISAFNNKNAIIDISSNKYKSDETFIKFLTNTVKETDKYGNKIIYIPVKDVKNVDTDKGYVGAICRYMKISAMDFRNRFPKTIFIFYNENRESLPVVIDKYKATEYKTFRTLLDTLISNNNKTQLIVPSSSVGTSASKSPVKDVISDKEKKEENKKEIEDNKENIVSIVADVTDKSKDVDAAWKNIEKDDNLKSIIISTAEEEDTTGPKLDPKVKARMSTLNNEFMKKKVHNMSIEDIMAAKKDDQLEESHLKVSSINDDWEHIKFINFQKKYDMNYDIINMLYSLTKMSYPVSIVNIDIEDTSTNMDYVYTYTVDLEDGFGKKSTLLFDIPKFKNNRFMKLRGNEKVMSGQLLLLPCLKTDEDTVQCVSNYKKIFIRRKGLSGKSYPTSDRLLKALKKIGNNDVGIKVVFGDNTTICSKYNLPVDYIDLCEQLARIETSEYIYLFNQDDYFVKYNADKKLGIPYAIKRKTGEVIYYNPSSNMDDEDSDDFDPNKKSSLLSGIILDELASTNFDFAKIVDSIKVSNTLNYSEASILNRKIPLVIVIGYSIGLENLLKRAKIKYNFVSDANEENKKKKIEYNSNATGRIKLSNGSLLYEASYEASMLLNGLSICDTEEFSLEDMNKRATWLDFLDSFGGRVVADGLDNFVDLFLDPITKEVCEHEGMPTNYFDLLIYANNLLSDNDYNRHTDISGNRYRTNELVAGYFYQALSKAYEEYKIQIKRGRRVGMSMKRSIVIDMIFQDPMTSDLSILNPLLEIEASNSVSFKGLSGMNSSRSYSLDKRTYDDSMNNKLALSTGFAANVGINRQTTIDMDINGKRGYINNSDNDEKSVAKTLSMTEAVTPFGTTHDDPFRSAMTFIQTSKHSMRTKKSMPLLITNGADEAMPYISSDTFAYKAKEDGVVVDITDEYMIIQYNKPVIAKDETQYTTEYVDLKEEVQKNSDGGFFITLKLDTDLKKGDKFKKGDIIAYDRTSFSNKNGEDDNLAYNVGLLAKVAILNTDEGFEDSTSVSTWLSEAMATDVVVEKDKDISKNTNVYYMVKVGDAIQEGDPLIIFQNSFDEKDANLLLKNITDPEFVSDLGRVKLKSKYTGVIQDIKIYRTCEISEMSESLQKIVTEYEAKIKAKKKIYEKYKSPGENLLDPDYKMEAMGKMKNNPDGIKIVFYIKYNDKLSVGDKVVAQSANKGVIKNIFPEGEEPFSEFRPNESIHALFAARSFNARMVTSVWVSGGINKCMIELDRAVKEIMGLDSNTKLEDMV